MSETSEQIKREFEERIESIEKSQKNRTLIFNTLLYTISIMLFLAVLCATIFSYNNYVSAKNKANDVKNNVKSIELKI